MADPSFIPEVADDLVKEFEKEGFLIKKEELISGATDISITKGGLFKAIAGLKTALKITLKSDGTHIFAEASVGIFGQQVVPTIISMLFFWPVVLTQIWGMIKQSKLDDHAMDLIEKSLFRLTTVMPPVLKDTGKYCPECGAMVDGNFCSSCGTKLN